MIGAQARGDLETLLGSDVCFDAPMHRHTSLRVGGPAEALATPPSRASLAQLLETCRRHGLPHLVLGRGFNSVVRDDGIEGVVIRLSKLRALRVEGDGRVFAEAGASHTAVTSLCHRHGWSGLEFAVGIPGTVGGWIAMNAGIPGREMSDVVRDVEVLDPASGAFRRVETTELGFHYRGLSGLPEATVLIEACFELEAASPESIREGMDRHLAHRAATQPLDVPSCGSVFRNPPGGHAGALIEAAGLKGHRVGGAEISKTHANFIENRGGASAADVLALVALAQERVARASGITLETEVRVFGRPTRRGETSHEAGGLT